MFNDIASTVDCGRVVTLLLLDLSAVFDTKNHSILLERLAKKHLASLTTLSNGSAHISKIEFSEFISRTIFSSPVVLRFGVSQGSVLGPLLFTIYTAELVDIVNDMAAIYTRMLITTRSIYTAITTTLRRQRSSLRDA